MHQSAVRTLIAGGAGGIATNLTMLLTFRLIGFGWSGDGVLLNPSIQSPKLIAVWTHLQPLPLVVSRPEPIVAGLVVFSLIHAIIYRWLAPAWPQGVASRALRMAALVFLLSFSFWEFFTPFNLFGEPVALILLELAFWAAIALVEAFVIATIMEANSAT